jgi:lipoprotein-releasing system permease protein
MFRPLPLCIGLRYMRTKRRQRFISFISLTSMIGIALGVMVLITVLSVVNGFDYEIKQRFFSITPQVTVTTTANISKEWSSLQTEIAQDASVTGVAPYNSMNGMLMAQGSIAGIRVMGILPDEEKKVSMIADNMVEGSLSSLVDDQYYMVVGQAMADRLNLMVGDTVTLFMPQTTITPLGIIPRYKLFKVTGIFRVGEGFVLDDSVAYINFYIGEKLASSMQQGIQGFHINLNNIYQAPIYSSQLQGKLPLGYWVTNWTEQFGAFFKALAMEKTMMFVILLFIIAVAAFNLVATLMMVVNDKASDIAILRTLGAKRRTIMWIFMAQGAMVGFLGTLLGLLGGVLLSLNITRWVDLIQTYFHVQFISSSVYFINFLPSKLEGSDLLLVGGLAFLLSLLATLYPAWRSFKLKPVEALRYE